MVKIKEYPPVISITTVIEDRLLGAKSYQTVNKRLRELKIRVYAYEMINTQELFDALMPTQSSSTQVIVRKSKTFKLRDK